MTTHELTIQHGGDILAASLAMPDSPKLCPGLVMLQGSGGEDRDNSGYFVPIREHLVARGVAVLSHDRPGVGGSSGDWRPLSLHERAAEALAALQALRAASGVDPARAGLYGHSQGGWVAPIAATLSSVVAFVVAVSGPGVTPAEQGLFAVETGMRAAGRSAAEAAEAVALVARIYALARRDAPFAEVEAELAAHADRAWLPDLGRYIPMPDPDNWRFFTRPDPTDGRILLDHDPVPVLARVRCPILAVFGADDPVLPAARSAALYRAALAAHPDATVEVLHGANHRLRVGAELAPGFLDLISSWILAR